MKIYDVFEVLQKRLTKKLVRARQAFIKENTSKKTQNCLNKGRNLAGAIYHCKINAMGEHEHGASQCWEEKASICPLFELRHSVEQLDRQFQGMDVEELSLRWPSIGELIRIQDLMKQADEIKHGQNTSRPIHADESVHLPDSVSKEAGGSGSDVSADDQHGPSGESKETNSIPESRGRDDSGGGSLDERIRTGMPLVSLGQPRDRAG